MTSLDEMELRSAHASEFCRLFHDLPDYGSSLDYQRSEPILRVLRSLGDPIDWPTTFRGIFDY